MQAVKATIKDGNVTLEQPVDIKGPVEAIVVVLDPDPWQARIRDPRPRRRFRKRATRPCKSSSPAKRLHEQLGLVPSFDLDRE